MNEEKFIGEKIRELRKSAGLDVDAVGKGVGRSGKTVSAWEAGINLPSAEMLITICRFFKVNISYFYPPDVTTDAEPVVIKAKTKELVDICSRLSDEQIDLLIMNARQFAVANEKYGAGNREDVERAGIAVM